MIVVDAARQVKQWIVLPQENDAPINVCNGWFTWYTDLRLLMYDVMTVTKEIGNALAKWQAAYALSTREL